MNLWCSGLARKVRSWHLASLHNSQAGNAGNAGKPMRENMTMITFGCLPYLSSGRSACHSPSITSVLSHFESFLVVEGIFIYHSRKLFSPIFFNPPIQYYKLLTSTFLSRPTSTGYLSLKYTRGIDNNQVYL